MPSEFTPEDIAKGLPDEDEFGTAIVEVIENDHRTFWNLNKIFDTIKQPNMWAQTLDLRRLGWAEVIVVYKSNRELSDEELLHEWKVWRQETYGEAGPYEPPPF